MNLGNLILFLLLVHQKILYSNKSKANFDVVLNLVLFFCMKYRLKKKKKIFIRSLLIQNYFDGSKYSVYNIIRFKLYVKT